MKVVVLGCLGMAGHVIRHHLAGDPDLVVQGFARQPGPGVDVVVDALDGHELETAFRLTRPDVVINCVGLLVKQANADILQALRVNALLPHELVTWGAQLGFRTIHISTDCVFSGKTGSYTVDSPTDALDNYGKTKALGEFRDSKNLTIRTSIVGPELKTNGTGLLDWYLKSSGSVQGYALAFWNGVTTLELARFISNSLTESTTGLVQLSVSEKISKADLLAIVKKQFSVSTAIEPVSGYKIDKSLVCSNLGSGYNVPGYHEQIAELYSYMLINRSAYGHYGSVL